MNHKTAYLWGPVSSFTGQLAAFLVQKGWHVHIPTKSAFQISLSPLDLRSAAQADLERAFANQEKFRIFEERVKFLDVNEVSKGTKYDALIFAGLPANYNEDRVARAPWAADTFPELAKRFKGTPVFIVSSLWGAVQTDGVVPEELECDRRKPVTRFEAVCQQYETRLAKFVGKDESPWYIVRLPMISGSTADGHMLNFSGPMTLFERLETSVEHPHRDKTSTLTLSYNPDATMWFLPVDVAAQIFWRLLEDDQRPRITNLVSTQATLNQEWLQHLAKALGFHKAVHAESDHYNLPSILRKTLNDNVLVKTRGLFEVMGRYQQVPTVIDEEYFDRVLAFGRSENWGKLPERNGKHEPRFSGELATAYFTDFLPKHVSTQEIKEVTTDGIGFAVDDSKEMTWVLRAEQGQPVAQHQNGSEPQPKVRFVFTSNGILKLVQRKISLERALVLREARVEGSPLEILKACNFFKRFLKEHPYNLQAEQLECLLQKT